MKDFIEGFIDGIIPMITFLSILMFSFFIVIICIATIKFFIGNIGYLLGLMVGMTLNVGIWSGTRRYLKLNRGKYNNKILILLREWL